MFKKRIPENKQRVITALVIVIAPLNIQAVDLSGGITLLGQSATDQRVENDITASIDLGITWPSSNGRWYMYLEGNNTPDDRGVPTLLIESNADAGTALDKDREGRLQLSELNYQFSLSQNSSLVLGMLDASAYMDSSKITNDENTQFIGVSFVNNPTIEFPDYALGLVQNINFDTHKSLSFILTSSNGLADNTNVSYGQLVNIDEPDKGMFFATRYGYETKNSLLGLGVWTHTAPHESFDGLSNKRKNYGAYVVSGRKWKHHAINYRLGIANPDVTAAHQFIALTYQYTWQDWTFGAASSKITLSDQVDSLTMDNTQQTEVYLRHEVSPGYFITGSLQHLVNSGFDASNEIYDDRIYISTIRMSYVFSQ